MRVLITGICGFVGATLARAFRSGWPDWEVSGVDNLMRPGSELNRAALRQIGVRVLHGDLRHPGDLEPLPAGEWIIDAAANPSVLAGLGGGGASRTLVEHNLVGTINLLELARSRGSGVILLSTSRVYGIRQLAAIPVTVASRRFEPSATGLPAGCSPAGVAEDFSTDPPLSLYGSTKRASEILALEYGETFGLPVFVNRCGVLAGPGQFGRFDQGIFSYWIHSYRARRPLKYIGFDGEGAQVRDCLDARDLPPLLAAQMLRPGKGVPRVMNLAGGLDHSASLRELSDWCAGRFGSHEIGADPVPRPFDVPWLVLDSALAGRAWGWRPETPLQTTWSEIADHADRNPLWLEMTADH